MRAFTDMFANHVVAACEAIVQPSLVAFYKANEKQMPEQVGTGFLIAWNGRPAIVTAKHVLRGHKIDENHNDKFFFQNDRLLSLNEAEVTDVFYAREHDLAAFHADRIDMNRCLPADVLHNGSAKNSKLLTIHGYLARDFNRGGGGLFPTPFVYTNKEIDGGTDRLTMDYPKRKNRNPRSGKSVMSPIPRGLSGCPMMDSAALFIGDVKIRGVFTDKPEFKGIGFGERSETVLALLNQM
ncbi:hypothetical protein [Mesorhizobium sp. WSM2239]|uniref:Serine protease n=2 Tax=unclassified Mesorhizobium TaxID=325217 RepID=A0AAU8DGN8_9HYPH